MCGVKKIRDSEMICWVDNKQTQKNIQDAHQIVCVRYLIKYRTVTLFYYYYRYVDWYSHIVQNNILVQIYK